MKKNKYNIEDQEFQAIIKDPNGKVVCKILNGRVFVTRFKNMDEITKKKLIELYGELTGKDVEKLTKFLNFESKENRFCS